MDCVAPLGDAAAVDPERKTPVPLRWERALSQARATGLEPATTGSTVRYSNQLSYAPVQSLGASIFMRASTRCQAAAASRVDRCDCGDRCRGRLTRRSDVGIARGGTSYNPRHDDPRRDRRGRLRAAAGAAGGRVLRVRGATAPTRRRRAAMPVEAAAANTSAATALKSGKKLHVNDSKLVYSPRIGLKELERSVLALATTWQGWCDDLDTLLGARRRHAVADLPRIRLVPPRRRRAVSRSSRTACRSGCSPTRCSRR